MAEGLNRPDTRDTFLQIGIEFGQNQPALAIHLARPAAIEAADVDNHRKRREADQPQFPIQPQHRARNAENDKQVAQQTDDSGAEQLVERFDIIDGPGHQTPHRIAVEVGHVLLLQVREDLHAQVMHGALAGVFGRVGLDEKKNKTRENVAQVEQHDDIQAVNIAVGDIAIDRDLGDVGAKELAPRMQQEECESERKQFPVRSQIAHDAAHEPRVIGFAEDLVVSMNLVAHGLASAWVRVSTSRTSRCLWYRR